MSEFDPIDGWFEKGFRIRRQKAATVARGAKRDAVRASSGKPTERGAVKFSSNAKIKNIGGVVRKAPEVMVKITGNSNGLKTVKAHLDYISRNGGVDLVDEHGETISGKAGVGDYRDLLKASQIPQESNKREFLHVLFSMPKNTPEKAMREAVAEFCKEEFSNRRYVMAFHGDTDHTHMHVCVGTRDVDRADEPRLSPRKADLFRWRQGFADKLRENGIDAAASYRQHRFQYHRPEKTAIRQIRADDPRSSVYNAKRAKDRAESRMMKAMMRPEKAFVGPRRPPKTSRVYESLGKEIRTALVSGKRPENPAKDRLEASRKNTLAGWEKVAANLEKSGDVDLARHVRELMQAGKKEPASRNQALYDAAVSGKSKTIPRKPSGREI